MIEQLELENLQNGLNGSSGYRVATPQETPIVCRIVCRETTTTTRTHTLTQIHPHKKIKDAPPNQKKNKLCQRLDGAMRNSMGMI